VRGFRFVWLDQVRDHVRDGALTWRASHVAYALAVHYTNKRCQAWPSQLELANSTGLGRRTVQRGLDELEQHELVNTRKGPPAHARGNVYTLRLCAPQAHSTTTAMRPTGALAPKRQSVPA